MNCQVHRLPELETATSGTREALQAIIHTILFIRSPGPVAPYDVQCESFQMTYTRIATDADSPPIVNNTRTSSSRTSSSLSSSPRQFHYKQQHQQFQKQQQQHPSSYHKSDLDRKVDDSIETFLRTLTPIGPELMAGNLGISFFERRTKNKLFGLVNQEEKVVWEQWILRVVVNNTPRPMGEDEASVIERQRIQVNMSCMRRCEHGSWFGFAFSLSTFDCLLWTTLNRTQPRECCKQYYSKYLSLPEAKPIIFHQ